MKYIKTKDGIFRVLQWGSKRKHYVSVEVKHYGIKNYDTNEVVSKAQTIEELCDEFVSVYDKYHDHWDNLKECLQLCWDGGAEIYGAIWTDKGLIYVAKMNDKGELELL